MNNRMKILIAATGVSLGLAALPASAQVLGGDRGLGYDRSAPGYHEDGTLNVFGAHIDPRGARTGGFVGGVGNAVGGVVSGVGNTVGGVVGGVTGAADDVVTGSIGGRPARAEIADDYDRPAGGRATYGRPTF